MSEATMENLSEFDDLPVNGSVDDLAVGEYEFAFSETSSLKRIAAKQKWVIEHKIEVLSAGKHAGQQMSWAWFLKDVATDPNCESRNRILRDLKTLGFDTGHWQEGGRKIGEELQKAIKCLKGLRFTAKKTQGTSGSFLNLVKRGSDDGLPRTFGPEELNTLSEQAAADDSPF